MGTQNILACVADVVAWIVQQAPPAAPCRWLACLNPHSYATALNDPPFAQALHAADWLIPDGSGIVLASKLLGGQIRERVTGSDIFRDVQVELNRLGGYRVFFLGSTEDTLAAIRQRLGAGLSPPPDRRHLFPALQSRIFRRRSPSHACRYPRRRA